jgi:hypothetical protein
VKNGMPQGYYTIEQWTGKDGERQPIWTAVAYLPFGRTQTQAEAALEKLGKHGFYRLVQTQRVIWAEKIGAKLHLRKSHAGSPASLEEQRKIFERFDGKFPVEEMRAARRRQKAGRKRL